MSSPIGSYLRQKRLSRGLRQLEMAKQMGYEQAYISAVELGTKTPSQEFLARVSQRLHFNAEEYAAMQQATKVSRRRFVLPVKVPQETYQLCNELWEKIDRLYPAQVVAIRQLLKLDDQIKDWSGDRSHTCRFPNQEAEM